jgi:glycogen synthase
VKLLFIVPAIPSRSDDSIWTYTRILARVLTGTGRHEAHILSCVEGQQPEDFVEQGVMIHCRGLAKIPRFGLIRRISRMPGALDRIRWGLSAFLGYRRLAIDFDIVEFPDWGALGWALAALRPLPLVEQLHAPAPFIAQEAYTSKMSWVEIRLSAFLERLAIRRANVVVSLSRAQAEAYGKVGWRHAREMEIIPQIIDWSSWRDVRGVSETKPTALFVGFLERRKAPEILIQAMSIVRRHIPEAEALFVGKVLQREGMSYLDWIAQSGLDVSGCRFLGHLPRQRLMEVMSESRVFVLPSRAEAFPLVAIEAMSAARPVVVTATSGGAAELVHEAGGGVVVPSDDPAALADAMLPFLSDPRHAAAVGAHAREVIRERMGPEKVAAQRELIYEKAIQLFKGARSNAQERSARATEPANGGH